MLLISLDPGIRRGDEIKVNQRFPRDPLTFFNRSGVCYEYCDCAPTLPSCRHPYAAEPVNKLVIAHRGASGYLPEHTLEAKVLAHAMGADYIEQDVVMTRDDALVVLHDLTLERVTDVAEKFPGRARADTGYYVIDFTLDELRTLQVAESSQAGARFPAGRSRFGIHTLAEEIELIQGLNQTTGREAGIYVEVKSPRFHHQAGKDLSMAILAVLSDYGYIAREDKVYLQTFDFNELKRIHDDLLPAMGMDIRLVQLIGQNEGLETRAQDDGQWLPDDYAWMHSAGGMAELARYADGVGPALDMIVAPGSTPESVGFTTLVADAHAAGLVVHPYTLRRDPGRMPAYAADFERLLEIFLVDAGVDGVFTDFPDLVLRFLENRR